MEVEMKVHELLEVLRHANGEQEVRVLAWKKLKNPEGPGLVWAHGSTRVLNVEHRPSGRVVLVIDDEPEE